MLCSCQEAKELPPPGSLSFIFQDNASGETRALHGQDTELEAIFDIITGTMLLTQKMRDPNIWPKAQHKTVVSFDQSNSTFVNLEGLADNSLLLTFKFNSPDSTSQKMGSKIVRRGLVGPKMNILHQDYGFSPTQVNEGPLYHNLSDIPTEDGLFQLHFPQDRIKAWWTVALVLLTYREINSAIWHKIVSNQSLKSIAGLNWLQVQDSAGMKSVDQSMKGEPVKNGKAKKVSAALPVCFELKNPFESHGSAGVS